MFLPVYGDSDHGQERYGLVAVEHESEHLTQARAQRPLLLYVPIYNNIYVKIYYNQLVFIKFILIKSGRTLLI